MKTEKISLHGKNYTLYIQYQHHEKLRFEFNRLTREFWDFDFENYYQSGFWDESCILYSLFDGDRIVAHTTVSLLAGNTGGEEKNLVQIGTVMTDEKYQKRGLSRFLMERIQKDFEGKNGGMFLFANETVLDFYPRFGFAPVKEYEAFLRIENGIFSKNLKIRKLDLDCQHDLDLFEKLVENSFPNTAFPAKSKSLTFFYCYANPEIGYKDLIYFIEELNCAVVAEAEGSALRIIEIFSPEKVSIHEIIPAFSEMLFSEVIPGFSPNQENFEYREWKDEDLQLFVSPELQHLFGQQPLKIPTLSHT
ncbi:MAG: GNAT family N-acetyltransferase [Chryseobacterium sp.]|uniref:GNAT family N-acetyltransferase n=1 Tax=Chryseobacterium sp. TaxID=1871047 RepID=UPI00282C612B|nr:GNAT family N-acetyltransferase [Chryseobacterium sp.]MDR2235217.1 GNAT family N-acetyltransferase [Chryseobacterium sp.]